MHAQRTNPRAGQLAARQLGSPRGVLPAAACVLASVALRVQSERLYSGPPKLRLGASRGVPNRPGLLVEKRSLGPSTRWMVPNGRLTSSGFGWQRVAIEVLWTLGWACCVELSI